MDDPNGREARYAAWMDDPMGVITRREARLRGRRKVLDNRRSVFLIQRLASEPKRTRRVSGRKRGA